MQPLGLVGLVGAVMFYGSDLAVARDRFVAPGFSNRAWGLPLYYAAQLVIAASTAVGGGAWALGARTLDSDISPVALEHAASADTNDDVRAAALAAIRWTRAVVTPS